MIKDTKGMSFLRATKVTLAGAFFFFCVLEAYSQSETVDKAGNTRFKIIYEDEQSRSQWIEDDLLSLGEKLLKGFKDVYGISLETPITFVFVKHEHNNTRAGEFSFKLFTYSDINTIEIYPSFTQRDSWDSMEKDIAHEFGHLALGSFPFSRELTEIWADVLGFTVYKSIFPESKESGGIFYKYMGAFYRKFLESIQQKHGTSFMGKIVTQVNTKSRKKQEKKPLTSLNDLKAVFLSENVDTGLIREFERHVENTFKPIGIRIHTNPSGQIQVEVIKQSEIIGMGQPPSVFKNGDILVEVNGITIRSEEDARKGFYLAWSQKKPWDHSGAKLLRKGKQETVSFPWEYFGYPMDDVWFSYLRDFFTAQVKRTDWTFKEKQFVRVAYRGVDARYAQALADLFWETYSAIEQFFDIELPKPLGLFLETSPEAEGSIWKVSDLCRNYYYGIPKKSQELTAQTDFADAETAQNIFSGLMYTTTTHLFSSSDINFIIGFRIFLENRVLSQLQKYYGRKLGIHSLYEPLDSNFVKVPNFFGEEQQKKALQNVYLFSKLEEKYGSKTMGQVLMRLRQNKFQLRGDCYAAEPYDVSELIQVYQEITKNVNVGTFFEILP